MATIPTQNAVPSEAPRDLKFNSGKIDEFVTSLEHEYKDRFGRCHMTIEGMRWIFEQLMERFKVDMNQAIIAAGYIPMDSFQQGAEITKRNEILRDETTGEYYRWDGDLPKSVPAGSTPESAGGVGMGAWVSVGDASLRGDLASEGGALHIDNGSIFSFRKKAHFSDGGTVMDNRDAVKHDDGFWYIWSGDFPYDISSSTPDTDEKWKCVGLLNGYAVNDAQNFGFTSGMTDALPALNAMIRSPFFKMTFPMCSTINIADKWAMRSFVDIDFNGSTIDWKGPILDGSNKSNGMNINVIHTEDFGGGTLGSYENIFIRNLNILGNDVGAGINFRNIHRFGIDNVYIKNCQRNGINISNCQFGTISNFHLYDCCPRSNLGFTESDLEAWGDGIAIWYGSTNIDVKNGNVEVRDIYRGGRGGFVIDGYAPPKKEVTREISCDNINVYGYDRPLHTELCGVVTISNSSFVYTSNDKHPFIKCSAVIWNVAEPTVLINCKLVSDRSILKTAGIKAKFIKVVATSITSVSSFFISGPEETGHIEWDGCDLHNVGGGWGIYNCSMMFDKCNITTDTDGDLMDVGGATQPQALSIMNSRVVGINVSGQNAIAGSVFKIINSDVTRSISSGPLAHLHVYNCNISGEVTANTVMRYNGQKPKSLHYLQNMNQQYNGMWLGTGKPAGARPDGSGDWQKGDEIINLSSLENTAYKWTCVTEGMPGRWAVSGSIGAGL